MTVGLEHRQAVHRALLENPRAQRPWLISKRTKLGARCVAAALRDLRAAGSVVREGESDVKYRAC